MPDGLGAGTILATDRPGAGLRKRPDRPLAVLPSSLETRMRLGNLLLAAAVVVFVVVIGRYAMGGPPGPRTFGALALGVVLLIAGLIMRRRPVVDTTTTTVPR